jgi:hypothetical protein
MAAKISKKNTVTAQGVLDLTDGIVKLEVEGLTDPVTFSELAKDFDGLDVKITIAYGEEIA